MSMPLQPAAIEVRFGPSSLNPHATRVIAQGDEAALLALFPQIVAEAGLRGYEQVALYSAGWSTCLAEWSWKGFGADGSGPALDADQVLPE